jgi:hypothetical protein
LCVEEVLNVLVFILLKKVLVGSVDKYFVVCRLPQKILRQRLLFRGNNEVYQSMFLKEGVNSHNRARIAAQVPSTGSGCKVGFWLHAPESDDELTALFVNLRGL